MVFSSITFIFAFLPIFLTLYYIIPKHFRNVYLLVVSIIFYLWFSPKFLGLLFVSITVNFVTGVLLNQKWRNITYKKMFLFFGVSVNVLLLGYFKYANFFIEKLNQILIRLGDSPIDWIAVALPIAISFYTFQQLSYLVDVYRGDKSSKNIVDYSLYVMLFPQLIAGPIVRWNQFEPQIERRKESIDMFFDGIHRFSIGLAQKVIFADILGEFIGVAFTRDPGESSLLLIWLIVLTYTFQIFFDFAGYTNMAIGLGKMIGFNFPENFDRPYISKSITDFWRRWHITLGTFLKDYIYIPLGGNRVSKLKNSLNFILVFGIGGLWHGVGLHFLVWGIYYGILLAAEKHVYGSFLKKLPALCQTFVTFILVMIGWVFFQASSVKIAFGFLKTMLIPSSDALVINIQDTRYIIFMVLAFVLIFSPIGKSSKLLKSYNESIYLRGFVSLTLLTISALLLSSNSFQSFIYEQF